MTPDAIPATGRLIGTPPSIIAKVDPQTEPIELDPLLDRVSDTKRIVYGNSSWDGITGAKAFSASAPCPIMRRLKPPTRPVSPTENGGKL